MSSRRVTPLRSLERQPSLLAALGLQGEGNLCLPRWKQSTGYDPWDCTRRSDENVRIWFSRFFDEIIRADPGIVFRANSGKFSGWNIVSRMFESVQKHVPTIFLASCRCPSFWTLPVLHGTYFGLQIFRFSKITEKATFSRF